MRFKVSRKAFSSIFYLYDDPNAVLRIDNTLPEVSFEVLTEANVCGQLDLPNDRVIQFIVTAYDDEDHMLKYNISGTRGKQAQSAGTTVQNMRPNVNGGWEGVRNQREGFIVNYRTGPISNCDPLAYNFRFHAYGLATNGYSVTPQRVSKEMNLVIKES